MSKTSPVKGLFYRDIQIIKFCKWCGVKFRPRRGSVAAVLGLCWKCRRESRKQYLAQLSSEQKKKFYHVWYKSWRKWLGQNLERRRRTALKSYHLRKLEPQNRARRHRRTKNLSVTVQRAAQ